jgi:beta-glucanase (GH16 family)
MKPMLLSILIFLLFGCTKKMTPSVVIDNPKVGDLIWSDEFNYSGLPDTTKWRYDVGGHGWGNNELQYYTEKRSENARIENGNLIIELRKEDYKSSKYTSARLVTKNKADFLYARIETRAKLPKGLGTWPAIWMLPTDVNYGGWPNGGEIDIMEHVGYDQNHIHGTIHTRDFNHTKGTQRGHSLMVSEVSEKFHTYRLDWRENSIEIFVDDIKYFTFEKQAGWDFGKWPFDKRFHLLLNIAFGGSWGGLKGVDDSVLPQQMIVDWVRVYKL